MLRQSRNSQFARSGNVGFRLILLLACVSSVWVLLTPKSAREGLEIWVFGRSHAQQYEALISDWNAEHPRYPATVSLLSQQALERRLMSGFFSGTPTAGLVELERSTATRVFAGPLKSIGMVDLTDRIVVEGIDRIISPAAFSAWTSRGRIFGLPHDIHPVLLAYRADILEEAGVSLDGVETWDDLFARLKPLQTTGAPRFAMAFSVMDPAQVEAMLLQAGGGFFDASERIQLDSEINARVLAKLVAWSEGPGKVMVEAPEFSASGNYLKLDGFILSALMPDWLCGVWRQDLPGLSGKLKVMPLPAWERGGRRTTVMGGTMLGLPKASPDFEKRWELAKFLYLSERTAVRLYEDAGIITPVMSHWNNPVFDVPNPYFSNQRTGRLFIAQAPDVPRRISSPFYGIARSRVSDAALKLRFHAREHSEYDPDKLQIVALGFLREAQRGVERQMERNTFWVEK